MPVPKVGQLLFQGPVGAHHSLAPPLRKPSNYHDDHHALFHVNFGQHLTWWDRLHGTLREQGRSYGVEVFGGKGAAAAGPAPDEVIPY